MDLLKAPPDPVRISVSLVGWVQNFWKLEIGNWKLETEKISSAGYWKLKNGNWKLKMEMKNENENYK